MWFYFHILVLTFLSWLSIMFWEFDTEFGTFFPWDKNRSLLLCNSVWSWCVTSFLTGHGMVPVHSLATTNLDCSVFTFFPLEWIRKSSDYDCYYTRTWFLWISFKVSRGWNWVNIMNNIVKPDSLESDILI